MSNQKGILGHLWDFEETWRVWSTYTVCMVLIAHTNFFAPHIYDHKYFLKNHFILGYKFGSMHNLFALIDFESYPEIMGYLINQGKMVDCSKFE